MKNIFNKFSFILIAAAISVVAAAAVMPIKDSEAAILDAFNPENIIDDSVFTDNKSMSAADIQSFLNSKNSVCLKNLQVLGLYDDNQDGLGDEPYGKGKKIKVSAATLIKQASDLYDISPRVILVTLQKEQGLITRTDCPKWRYNTALGYGCPDSAPCDDSAYGFTRQIDYGVWHFQGFYNDTFPVPPTVPGSKFIAYNPEPSCGGKTINIRNKATAALYSYTPYQPNKAALAAGLGEVTCGAYGNRNFFYYFTSWFGTTRGTPFFKLPGSSRTYIEGANNSFYYVPHPDLLRDYGYGRKFTYIRTVPSSYTNGMTNNGSLGYMARFEGDEVYFINQSRKSHAQSREIIQHYGLTLGNEALLPAYIGDQLASRSPVSDILALSDGAEVYYIQSGSKHHITSPTALKTMGDPIYSSRPKTFMSSRFASSIPETSPIMLNGTYIKYSDSPKYGLWDGAKIYEFSADTYAATSRPAVITKPQAVFSSLGKDSTSISRAVKSSNGDTYIIGNNTKYLVNPTHLANFGALASQAKLVPDAFLGAINKTSKAHPAFRVDNGADVYFISDGKYRHATSRGVLNELGFPIETALNLDRSTASLFQKVDSKLYQSAQLYRIEKNSRVDITNAIDKSIYVPSRSVLKEYGLSLDQTISVQSGDVSSIQAAGTLGSYVKDSSGQIWLVTLNQKLKVSPTLAGAANLNLATGDVLLVSTTFLNRIAGSSNATPVMRVAGNDRVYKIENGKKRWVTSRSALEAKGYSMDDVISVSSYYLGSIPNGSNI